MQELGNLCLLHLQRNTAINILKDATFLCNDNIRTSFQKFCTLRLRGQ